MDTLEVQSRYSFFKKIALPLILGLLSTSCTYMKMNPPPDADKVVLAGNNSCWLATASNMLAGAGYGSGATVQARADDIYADMTGNYGVANGGWTDTAVSWWLGSSNNTWTTNSYTVVTVYGNKSPKYPWSNADGAEDIGNELRTCNLVGISISWPTDAVVNGTPVIGSGGHAITGWGDSYWLPWEDYSDPITANPSNVRVSDSDNDTGGNVQRYRYDGYNNPNPGGANEGNGWYFSYDPNHPYIKHIITLTPTQTAGGGAMTQRVLGSYKIHQDKATSATDLHYQVGTDAEILTYNTRVDWEADTPPDIQESQPQRRSLDVDWDFTGKPVPQCEWVTIDTEFILRAWNAISYEDVHFTYPDGSVAHIAPDLSWEVRTPEIENAATIQNVTGGYMVGSFDIIDPRLPGEKKLVGEYRFVHQYSFNQSPEQHTLALKGKSGFQVTNVRFGHSYGYLNKEMLWSYQDWLTDKESAIFELGESPVEIAVNWAGRLPYPEGEDIRGRIPEIKRGLILDPRKMR